MDLWYGNDDDAVSNHVEQELLRDFKTDEKKAVVRKDKQLSVVSQEDTGNVEKMFIYSQLLSLEFNKPEIKNEYYKFLNKNNNRTIPVSCIDGTVQVPIYKLDYLDYFKVVFMSSLPKFASMLDLNAGLVFSSEEDQAFSKFTLNLTITKDLLTKLLSPFTSLNMNLAETKNAESIKKIYTELQDIPNIIVAITLLGFPRVYKYLFYKLSGK